MRHTNHGYPSRLKTASAAIISAVLALTPATAIGDAVIGTYAQNNLMVPDGTTVYTAWVFADNTGLNGELTWGAQYDFFLPPYATLIPGGLGVAYGTPDPARDFFSGDPMIFETIASPGLASGRLVNQADQVANTFGDLQFYKFTINPDAPIGPGNFDLGPNTALTDPTSLPQPFDKQNIPFNITPLAGDISIDGFVGIDDLNLVLSHWNTSTPFPDYPQGDTNGDRFVGIDDLNWVLGNWNGGSPPARNTVPEPAGTCWLAAMGLVAIRRIHKHK